jgi:Leucine-rich repeat (LRR) protein
MGCGGSKDEASSAASTGGGDGGEGKATGGGNGGGGAKAKDLSNKELTSLPSIPPDTTELNVSENKGLSSLETIGTLTKLTTLDANGCALTAVPAEIEGCVELEELLLYANKIKDVPAAIGKLEALTTINLFNNQVRKLPAEIGTLGKLEEVNIAANKMMMTNDAMFASWANVKILSLYENNLVRMGSLAPLVALTELRLNGNNLEESASRAPPKRRSAQHSDGPTAPPPSAARPRE